MPQRTYLSCNEDRQTARGTKDMHYKNRLSAFLCTNADGTAKPMDMGIIAATKLNYRRELLEMKVSTMVVAATLHAQAKERKTAAGTAGSGEGNHPHVRDAAELLKAAWGGVSAATIARCWVKAKTLPLGMEADHTATHRKVGQGGSIITATLLLLLSTVARSAENVIINEGDSVKLAEIRSYLLKPRFEGVDDAADLLPDWYTAWRIVLHNQVDRLFAAVEKRSATLTEGSGASSSSPRLITDDGLGFKIHVVGDSTMRMQANVLAWILLERITLDGKKQCKISPSGVTMCTGAAEGIDANGNPPERKGFALSLQYTKVNNGCVSEAVDADFVYFGCGLHLLQLIPDIPPTASPLDAWMHYERLLEEAVSFYRSGGGIEEKRVPVGEAFMTTHSFAVDVLNNEYAVRVREYEERNETLLTTCREAANNVELTEHEDWPNEYEPEDICTRGILDESGVVYLNDRAEEVMDRLGVPIVRGYDITEGQSWATRPADGRHYPVLIPLELSAMMSEVSTALRRERRVTAA
eukprot:jgi/Undpi1/12635/HiC_scaffold_6.g02303.m1